jgi:lipopolysaccharide assembly protein A
MSDPTERTPAKRPEDKPDRAGNTRVAAAAVLGGIAAVFALINLDDVEVNWLVGSWQTPLIVVIALSILLGAGLDRLLVRRARKRKLERRSRSAS